MLHGQSRLRGVVTMMLAAACSAAGVHAQLQERDALTPVIGNLPLNTRLVIISSKPSAVLDELKGPWKRLGPLATGLGGDTLKSWGQLSRKLGYAPGEAFNALTSGGLALVVADATVSVNAGGAAAGPSFDARWAVVTVVKGDVAARVRDRLKASPHEVIGGRPVLSVEDGRFALVCRGLTDAEGSDEVLALTPTEDRAFLESVVAAVEAARPRGANALALDAASTLASTAAFAAGKRTATDVLLLAAEGAEGKLWESASVVACGMNERSWTFDIEQAGLAPTPAQPFERVPAEASAWFDAWSPGAAVMFVSGGKSELNELMRAVAPAMLPEKERLEGVTLYAGNAAAGPVALWAGVRVSGGDRAQADAMDAAGERVANLAENGDWPQELAASFDPHSNKHKREEVHTGPSPYAAAGPLGLRVASVKIPPGASLAPLSQGEPAPIAGSVVWFQSPAGGAEFAEHSPRWMVWGVEPTQDGEAITARHREVAGLLKRVGVADHAWLWRGVVRPARVLEALPTPLAFAAGLTGAGAVKELRFEAWDEVAKDQPARSRGRIVVEWGGGVEPKR